MKKETFFSLILLVPSYIRAVDITNTTDCHLSEWREKSAEFKCANGEQYFCSLDENNLFIHGCLKQYRIPANTTGCPFVVRSTKYLPYENKYTRCNVTLVGCPPKNHPGYAISELHKYPLCLVIPEKRDHNITVYPETTSQYSPSTVSTADTQKTTNKSENTTISTGGIDGGLVAAIVVVLVLVVTIVFIAAIFIWQWKKSEKGCLEFVQSIDCGSRYSKKDIKDGGEEVGLTQVTTSRSNSNEEESGEESDSTEDGQQSEVWSSRDSADSNEAVTKNLFDFVKKGNEGKLKRLLLWEHEKIQQNHRPYITKENIKKAICMWIKLWDRPRLLNTFHTLALELGGVDNSSSLQESYLKPDEYEASLTMLLYAGRLGRKKTVSFLLDEGPPSTIQMVDKDKNTILHHVVAMKSLELTKKVLQLYCFLLNEVNIDSQTAFIMAAKSGCEDIVHFLLQGKAKVMDEKDSFETITEECVRHNWSEIFGEVLSQNKDELLTFKGDHDHCHKFQAGKVIRLLLESYSDDKNKLVDLALQAFPDMFTSKAYYLEQHPLIWVVGTKNKNAIDIMLSKTNPEDLVSAVDSHHRTILHICILKRISVDLLKNEKLLLLLNTKDNSNNSPIMYAAKLRSRRYFDELLQIKDVTLIERDTTGKNILHLAVKNNWCRKSEKLLNQKDKDALLRGDNQNVTPLMLAVSLLREPRVIKLLLDNGSEISDRDHVGKTLFHYFAENSEQKHWEDRKKCIDVLLECEKFKNSRHLLKVKDFNGKTPIDIARERGDHECLTLFNENLCNEEDKSKEQCNGVD